MSSYQTIEVKTTRDIEFIDITAQVRDFVRTSKYGSGILLVYTPHTTAAVTIN